MFYEFFKAFIVILCSLVKFLPKYQIYMYSGSIDNFFGSIHYVDRLMVESLQSKRGSIQ